MTEPFYNPDYLISSSNYEFVLNQHVLPYLNQIKKNQMVKAYDGISLFCSSFQAEAPKGTVLIVHGFTESSYKYSELIFSFLKNQYSVVAYDQRGHGLSDRPAGLSHMSVTHVEHFSDYVEDLQRICSDVLQNMPKPWIVFAHSMGGAVTSLYLEQYPDTFSAASLCSPMIAPNTGKPSSEAALIVCRAACALGHGKKYPFFMKPYSGPEDFNTSCATDPCRFSWYDKIKASHPEYQNSIPTYRWTLESILITKKILSPGSPESIRCPVMLSTAEYDSSVLPEPQKLFIHRVPKGKQIFVHSARHEIFRSVNDVLFPWWHEVLSFYQEAIV